MTLIEILESLKQGELGLYRAYIAENNINALAEEAKKRVENGELNNIAKGEVEEFKLDENQYRQALSLLKISNGTQGLFNQAVNAYKSASKSLEELVEERNIGQIAKRYDQFKDEVSTEELILLNVGELEDNYKDDGTIEQIKKSKTFSHQLFEAGISKENVMHYFAKVHDVLGYDKELAKNYMSLSDNPGGISIIELLKQHNNKVGYQGIYDELKEKYVRLFPIEGGVVEIQVDTHTGSIHSSVDKSLVRIGEELKDERITKVNERELKVERDSEWNKEIDGTITELKERLISLNEKEIPAYISDTLSKKDDIQEEVAKFKYQIETALRLIDGLEKGRYGSTYTVDAVTPTSCGFSVKEIVAIAYKELSNKENWENPESEKQHFITFIEGLYDAKKGYNIDRHLKGDIDQWQEHRTEGDNNRCTSGAVNSVVKHISDHKLVNIQIINANTMQGPIENHLGDILDKLYQDTEQNKELIGQWLYIGIIKEDLLAKIKNKLKEDMEFTNEFNEEAIDRFAGPAIRSIKTQLLKQIAKSFKEFKQLNDNQLLMRDFVFNEEKGYVLYMEELYKKEDEVFKNIIENEIKRTMIVDEDSELSRKGRTFINLLLSSNNKEFRLEVKNKVKVVFSEELSQNSINNLLILSAKYGNKELFNTLLDVKADITAKDVRNNNMTPLHHAALSGQTNIVKIILEAKPEAALIRDNGDNTPLHTAVYKGYIDIVKIILEAKPKAALVKDFGGNTPLYNAALRGQTDIVKIIVEAVPKAALVKDKYHSTPLHHAAEQGLTDIVKIILEAKPEAVLIRDNRGNTPLRYAAGCGHRDIVEKLLAINSESALIKNYYRGETPLHHAAEQGLTDIVKVILEAKPEAALEQNIDDYTPLHTAAEKGRTDIVKIILEAKPEAALEQNNRGDTPLHIAAERGRTDIVKELLEAVPEAALAQDDKGNTALYLAALSGQTHIVKIILEAVPEADWIKDNGGNTPLHTAAFSGQTDIVEKLLAINSEAALKQNKEGSTPLYIAAKIGHKDIVKIILEAKPEAALEQNNEDDTPLHTAAEKGLTDIVKIILEAKPEAALVKNYRGDTPLHHTALSGQTDIVKIILEAVPKAALVKDKYRSTPLHIAAERGRTDIVKELLEAVPEAALKQNKEGSTPLHNAALSGQTDIVKIIVEAKSEAALIRDNGDNTPLHTAVYKGYIDIVKIILEAVPEAALIKNYKEGYTLLHDVVLSDKTDIVKTDIVKIILEAVPEAALIEDFYGNTPLYTAAFNGQTDIVEKLLAINSEAALIKNYKGNTPLHAAAFNGQTDIVKIIVEAKPEAALKQNKEGSTPLYLAALRHQTDIVKIILEALPEVDLDKDFNGNAQLYYYYTNVGTSIYDKLLGIIPSVNHDAVLKVAATISFAMSVNYLFSDNMKRSEKVKLANIIGKDDYNFIEELRNINKENNEVLEQLQQSLYEENIISTVVWNASGSTNIIPEYNHLEQHGVNIEILIAQIEGRSKEENRMEAILLERKEEGSNLGMKDVKLLAAILKHNEISDDKISLPEGIEESLIYQDAKLYNTAMENGVVVLGMEGKGLEYSKKSTVEYTFAREKYMAEKATELIGKGYNVSISVGANHVNNINSRLAEISGIETTNLFNKEFENTGFANNVVSLLPYEGLSSTKEFDGISPMLRLDSGELIAKSASSDTGSMNDKVMLELGKVHFGVKCADIAIDMVRTAINPTTQNITKTMNDAVQETAIYYGKTGIMLPVTAVKGIHDMYKGEYIEGIIKIGLVALSISSPGAAPLVGGVMVLGSLYSMIQNASDLAEVIQELNREYISESDKIEEQDISSNVIIPVYTENQPDFYHHSSYDEVY